MKRHMVMNAAIEAVCGKPDLYAHGNAVEGGRTIYIAGQYAPGEGDAIEQYRSCLRKIQTIVEAEGGTLQNLVRMVNYISSEVDVPRDWPRMLEARREMFKGDLFPAGTAVVVSKLMNGALVEVDAIAVV